MSAYLCSPGYVAPHIKVYHFVLKDHIDLSIVCCHNYIKIRLYGLEQGSWVGMEEGLFVFVNTDIV